MKLVVGLGNPGPRYRRSRHNVGFAVLERLIETCGQGKPKIKFQGEIVDADVSGQRVLLLRPMTYMNRSGTSVRLARDYYGLENESLLVVCDDINLSLARLRFRARGSAGGQKGLADVIERLQTQEISRLRVGIGLPPDGWDAVDYVLSRFRDDEVEVMGQAIQRAAEAVTAWASDGITCCMNRYNAC